MKIIHGNVRSSNILVSSSVTALLCDFGRSREVGEEEDLEGKPGEETPLWLRPKASEGLWKQSFVTDIYAFGMTIYQVRSAFILSYRSPQKSPIGTEW